MGWRGVHLLVCVAIANVSLIFNLAEGDDDHNRAVFIFGDSTADVGTNNNLNGSRATANHPYNGIDYPNSKATGRFSNGYNSADLIVRLLGDYKESPPPFLTLVNHKSLTFKRELLHGANFASGGSGILKQTGQARFGRVISLGEQIQQFAVARGFITQLLGAAKAKQLLSNSIYIMSIGSNDLVDYQLSNRSIPADAIIANLRDTYAVHLQKLHKLGARKFGIISVPPIGCCPAERAFNLTGGCRQEINDWALAFYTSIRSMLENFSSQFQQVNYSLGNAYQMTMNIINNPRGTGLKDVKTTCCGDGLTPCHKGGKLCKYRDDYLFWDWFHPTQAASKMAAHTLVYDEQYTTPMNFSRLAMI